MNSTSPLGPIGSSNFANPKPNPLLVFSKSSKCYYLTERSHHPLSIPQTTFLVLLVLKYNCQVSYMLRGFPGGTVVKNLLPMQETQVLSLGQKDPLEKEMAAYGSVLAWDISMDRGAWQVTVHGVAES